MIKDFFVFTPLVTISIIVSCLLINVLCNGAQVVVDHKDEIHRFILQKTVASTHPLFDAFQSFDGERFKFDQNLHKMISSCITYESTDPYTGSQILVRECGNFTDGTMLTTQGDLIVLESISIERGRNFFKRSAPMLNRGRAISHEKPRFELPDLKMSGDFFSTSNKHQDESETKFMLNLKGPIIVELAIFSDEELWNRFRQKFHSETVAEAELRKFVFATLDNVNLIYSQKSMDPKIIFSLKRYELIKKSPSSLQGSSHDKGDVDKLLTNFCLYQKRLNAVSQKDPKHWDHAVLLTGFDMHVDGNYMAAGYAPVKGMCSQDFSCTIVEGYDFSVVYTLAHELGHSMGMLHDGKNNNCSPKCCIMSFISGGGKTTWSSCSIKELHTFLSQLGRTHGHPNCLTNGHDVLSDSDGTFNVDGVLPGQRYTADEQCALTHGRCFRKDLKEGAELSSVCRMVYCSANDGFIFSAEPALEGTYCGNGKWCLEGECRSWGGSNEPKAVNGQWSEWTENTENSCGSDQCSTCEIKNQLRIRRIVRYCDSPAMDNGGSDCKGFAYRGVVCDKTPCLYSESAESFATKNCTKIMKKPGIATKMPSNGKGTQQFDDPCKMWCQMTERSDYFWTVYNFPDGTPCGSKKYCIAGTCLKLSCGSNFIVSNSADCPKFVDESIQNKETVSRVELTTTPSPRIISVWSAWSAWSPCSKSCGSGTKARTRQCVGTYCSGQNFDSSNCDNPICRPITLKDEMGARPAPVVSLPTRRPVSEEESAVSSWGPWTTCDRPCGGGEQKRTRHCRLCPRPVVDVRSCETQPC